VSLPSPSEVTEALTDALGDDYVAIIGVGEEPYRIIEAAARAYAASRPVRWCVACAEENLECVAHCEDDHQMIGCRIVDARLIVEDE